MTATAERDEVQEQLCARIDELERDKEVLATQVDRLEEELAEARRAQAIMRDTFATQTQQAVKRARKDWAAQGSPWVKARWQAEAMEAMAARLWPVGMIGKGEERTALLLRASELRRQAEGGE